MEANRILYSEFGTLSYPDPCKTIFQRLFWYFQPPTLEDNCNINWLNLADELYVCTESQYLRKVNPVTLETGDKLDYSQYVSINTASAHPHTLPDGTVYNVGYSFGITTTYNIIKIQPKTGHNALESATIVCSIPTRYRLRPSYFHSFAITANFIVFLEQPLFVNVLKIASAKFMGKSINSALEFDPQSPAIFHIISRHSGKPSQIKYVADGFFCFHHVNAYEENNHIIIDLSAHTDITIIQSTLLEKVQTNRKPILDIGVRRYTIPIDIHQDTPVDINLVGLEYTLSTAVLQQNGEVYLTWESITNTGIELPIINYEEYNGRKYRYAYGVSPTADSLIKVDFETKSCKEWKDTKYHYPGEVAFVTAPEPSSEDDGVLISCILSSRNDMPPYLLILDARTFEEIARAEVSVAMAFALHTMFIKHK
ncbi:beta,beta-carotene 15,15'-dioxygenase-like isoform X2 [Ptychodera flava]